MPQEPKSLLPKTRFNILSSLWKSIDEKTDRLLPLLELLKLMKTESSELGKQLLEALSLLNEELRLNRELRHKQVDALKASLDQQKNLMERLDAIDAKQDKLLKTMNIPMD